MKYSFNELCVPCYPELLAYACKRTSSWATAEDIVQEAMERAWKAWDRWDPQEGELESQARAWLYRIVGNTFANFYQKAKNQRQVFGTYAADIATALHVPVDETTKSQLIVEEALELLSPEHAEILRLVYLEGYTALETAAMLKIPAGTVRSRVARGRTAMAKVLTTCQAESAIEASESPESQTDSINSIMRQDNDALFASC